MVFFVMRILSLMIKKQTFKFKNKHYFNVLKITHNKVIVIQETKKINFNDFNILIFPNYTVLV